MGSIVSKSHFKRLSEVAESLIDWTENVRCRHFSFILYKKRIIAIGTNKPKTHPTNLINRKVSVKTGEDFSDQKHICSEFSAITKLKNLTNIDTKKCTLVNLRYDRNKKVNSSYPCMSCRSLLSYFEFKNIYCSDSTGNFQSIK